MGNKINATGFRTGVNKNWKSIWYQPKSAIKDTVLEDVKIRKAVKAYAKKCRSCEVSHQESN